jgi:predicted peroxiredoxin
MQKSLKYTVAITAFAAVLLVAAVVFPAAVQQVQADSGNDPKSFSRHGSTILVHITSGDPTSKTQLHSAKMGMHMAQHMQEQGMNVIVFLDVDGPRFAVQSSQPVLSDHKKMVQDFIDNGGRVLVCEDCLNEDGYKSTDLLPGVELARPAKMSSILSDDTKVIDY